MNEIKVQVNFKTQELIVEKDKNLITGDYATSKLIFSFDDDYSAYRLVFGMKNPNGEVVMIKDIEDDNEIVLVSYNEEGKECSLFGEAGRYLFEVSRYGDGSRLTSAYGSIYVEREQVRIGDDVFTPYVPIIDQLFEEVEKKADKTYVDEAVKNASSGTTDYNELENKPKINGVELLGDKSTDDLHIVIPSKLSEFENDKGYIDETSLKNYYTKEEVDGQIDAIDLTEYYTKDETDAIIGDIETALKPKKVLFTNGATITAEDNTSYYADTEITNLTIVYPETDFICSFDFTIASEGDVTITLPESKYIGGTPSFANGETWEVNIKNGVVVGGLVE